MKDLDKMSITEMKAEAYDMQEAEQALSIKFNEDRSKLAQRKQEIINKLNELK